MDLGNHEEDGSQEVNQRIQVKVSGANSRGDREKLTMSDDSMMSLWSQGTRLMNVGQVLQEQTCIIQACAQFYTL